MNYTENSTEILSNIFDKTQNSIASVTIRDENNTPYIEEIFTPIFHDAARFIEHYTYDFIITWNYMLQIIEEMQQSNEETRKIITFAMRKSGCDGETFLFSRLGGSDSPYDMIDNYYRRIYAVEIARIKPFNDEYATRLTLKNIQGDIISNLPKGQ